MKRVQPFEKQNLSFGRIDCACECTLCLTTLPVWFFTIQCCVYAEAAQCGSGLSGSAVWYKMRSRPWPQLHILFRASCLTVNRQVCPAGNILKVPNWMAASLTAVWWGILDCFLSVLRPSVTRQHSGTRALHNQQCWLGCIFLSDCPSLSFPSPPTWFLNS